jgi:signal transduction histidine kinase
MIELEERRALICAPFGQDAELAARVMKSIDQVCHVCKSWSELMDELGKGAGLILTVEEVLTPEIVTPFIDYLTSQPTWSDLPVLVLTKPGGASTWLSGAYENFGNLTLLERPVRATTLLSATKSALRARMRQYEIREFDKRKDEFLAMLAHELRNPLAPINFKICCRGSGKSAGYGGNY